MTSTVDSTVAGPGKPTSRWRGRAFGPASELPYRRRTRDVVVGVLAFTIVGLTIAHYGHSSKSELDLFEAINGLPNELDSAFRAIYGLSALWAVGLVLVAALVARRWRLARDLAIAGVVSWAAARVIGEIVAGSGGISASVKVVVRIGQSSPSFPVARLAVLVAVISAASPYLTRPVRRLGQLLVLLTVFAALYLGVGLPNAAVAGIALGWGVAAVVHFAFGSPGGRPTSNQVAGALADLGIDATDVALVDPQPRHGTVMMALETGGPLAVRVLGRDETDAQTFARLWRFTVYKDGGPRVHLTRLEDVEQEAYALLLAERAGVRVPPVVVAGSGGPNAALLVTRPLGGISLADATPDRANDATLDAVWHQVSLMHGAHVAHSRLNTGHLVLTADGPGIVDFEDATGSATEQQQAADVAELLVSTAAIVGTDRAVTAAKRGLGREALERALPLLQPAALSRDLHVHGRERRKELHKRIDDLRAAAASAAGSEAPPLQELHRVSTTNLLMAVGTLIAIGALLSQVGSPQELWDTVTSANIWWLVVALLISFATNIATAIALMGTVPIPLPLWRTSELQLSMSFSNLAVPAVGGMAAQIRFLQRQGCDLASAVASGGLLINAGNILAQVVLFGFALLLSPNTLHFGQIPTSSIFEVVLIAIALLAIAAAVIRYVPRIRRAVVPQLRSAATTMWEAARSPRRVACLLGGNAINAVMYALVLDACVAAFGGSINFWTLLAINIFVSTIASLVPIPGGNTAVSAVGLSGALTAAGVPTAISVAAVLTDQLVTSFIPAVPGWFATNDLLHHEYL
jgi:undecaprenyl-diphosphatase